MLPLLTSLYSMKAKRLSTPGRVRPALCSHTFHHVDLEFSTVPLLFALNDLKGNASVSNHPCTCETLRCYKGMETLGSQVLAPKLEPDCIAQPRKNAWRANTHDHHKKTNCMLTHQQQAADTRHGSNM